MHLLGIDTSKDHHNNMTVRSPHGLSECKMSAVKIQGASVK